MKRRTFPQAKATQMVLALTSPRLVLVEQEVRKAVVLLLARLLLEASQTAGMEVANEKP